MNGMFYRGEVYYVYPTGNEIGSEQHAGRPAIIVSNSQNNKNSSTLEIVYLTTREKRPMQTHVHINAAGKLQESTALCEQIFTVDKLRLNDYIGQLCDKEIEDVQSYIDQLTDDEIRQEYRMERKALCKLVQTAAAKMRKLIDDDDSWTFLRDTAIKETAKEYLKGRAEE